MITWFYASGPVSEAEYHDHRRVLQRCSPYSREETERRENIKCSGQGVSPEDISHDQLPLGRLSPDVSRASQNSTTSWGTVCSTHELLGNVS
jgi:hypothetical protein